MEIWKAIVLGTVQGLTEFLPVSSSGHLSFLHKLLGADFGGNILFFDIMLHFGTLFAVIAVFFRDIRALFRKPFKTLLMLCVATVPAGIVGLLFGNLIDGVFNGEGGLLYLAVCFCVTALLLLLCEVVAKRQKKKRAFGWRSAMCMGLMQAVALFPGISRSGSTLTAGVLSGADTEESAKFSFLMSIPIILGSVAVSMKDLFDGGSSNALAEIGGTQGILAVFVGVLCAAVFGFFAIKAMLKISVKGNYKPFSLYLVLLAMACLWLDVLGILPLI